MRVVFAGTPQFAVPSLQALVASSHDVAAVLTQPDRPRGRGQRLQATPVKLAAQSNAIDVYQPQSLKNQYSQDLLKSLAPHAIVVVAYGLFFPPALLNLPDYGCVNLHPSLLPRWRGAAPIQHAIMAGDYYTGVTIMHMGQGMDDGDILWQQAYAIDPRDTAASLHEQLSDLGGQAMVETLGALESGKITPQAQDERYVTYANKITKSDALIDWHESARTIERKVRAFNPTPGAMSRFQNKDIKIWEAKAGERTSEDLPGTIHTIHQDSIDVTTGEDYLRIYRVQRPGSRAITVEDWLNTVTITAGQRFG